MTDLLTKYRPTKFSEVIGQGTVVRSLQAALKRKAGRAFLFTGPSGTGKTTLARITAAELGCLPQDLQEINAAKYTGIDDMRDIVDGLRYRPLGGGAVKGVIVDECHALSKSAWQSILKPTEEPSEFVCWLFCTTEVGKVPATIKNQRCLTYELKPVKEKDLDDLYARVIEAENIDIPVIVADLIIAESNGSPRQMLANLAVCLDVKTKEEAAELLQSAAESSAAIDLARALFKGTNWKELQRIIAGMTEVNAESVRHVVRAYGTKIVLTGNTDASGNALAVLDAFSQPFNSSDGITPLLLACGRLTLLSPA